MPESPLERLQATLDPLRRQLFDHAVYQRVRHGASLRIFMRHHVFAVWDFMSLLKTLQRKLCCVAVPWLPPANSLGARLVNEIVLAEETDQDRNGSFASHFELYHQAMQQCGAGTEQIDQFLDCLRQGRAASEGLDIAGAPVAVSQFVRHTFRVIEDGSLPEIAAVFTFGREDLLPGVFQKIVEHLNQESAGEFEGFRFYLGRHIELDGDEHGPLALRLMESLCGTDEARWRSAEQAAAAALTSRIALWDGMLEAIIAAEEPIQRHAAV